MMHTFIIEGRLAGLNELIAAERANRYKGAQMKRNAQTYVEYAVKTQLRGVRFSHPVRLRYTTDMTTEQYADAIAIVERWAEKHRKQEGTA